LFKEAQRGSSVGMRDVETTMSPIFAPLKTIRQILHTSNKPHMIARDIMIFLSLDCCLLSSVISSSESGFDIIQKRIKRYLKHKCAESIIFPNYTLV
jgi:hypothetical protein